MKNFIRIASLAVLAGTAGIAAAQSLNSDVEIRTKTVTFDPAAIQTDAGAQDFYQRLRSAARDVCAEDGYPRVLMREEALLCATEAVDHAVREVNLRTLTDVHLREGEVNVGAIEN